MKPEETKNNPTPDHSTSKTWWKESVIYQIYPRSFKDSNKDGIGDLKGIISKLDYIQSLGVDIVWLSPIYASPNDDNGYDISDYREIMKDFGTMDDFDFLLKEVHRHRLKLILDLVVNHTSDEHPWFVEASKSRSNPYYDYYHWWPAEKGEPPLRRSYFDEKGDAWRYNPYTDSFFLHYFSAKQPDLNWENPEVRKQIYEMMKFWLDKGIDGFRMDSISLISKDISFPVVDPREYPDIFETYAKGPHLHQYLHEMNREVLSRYDIMTVGEGSAVLPHDVYKFVDPAREELNMLYTFGASHIRNTSEPDSTTSGVEYSLIALKQLFSEVDRHVGNGWPTVYLGNHDQPRMVTRFGSDTPEFREVSAKMLATFLLTMRGTPYWYAGDEIGMTNIKFDKIEDYQDIDTRNHYIRIKRQNKDTHAFLEGQKLVARDNARTPFQWDDTTYAGFSPAVPWLKVNPNYPQVNVAREEISASSVLNYFKKAVALRKAHPGLVYGLYTLIDPDNTQVYAYTREGEGEKLLVVLNFSTKNAEAYTGIDLSHARLILSNYADAPQIDAEGTVRLRPFEAAVYLREEAE